jgi:hypothetical protein
VKKTVLAYILLATFSIQLIPIKEIGSILYGNQMIEEICSGIDGQEKTADFNEDVNSKEFDYNKLTADLIFFIRTHSTSNLMEKYYGSRLADDTPTRPPLGLSV